MNSRKIWMTTLIACAGLLALRAVAVATLGTSPSSVPMGTGSTLWIEGKSNLHDFESRTSSVAVRMTPVPSASATATSAEMETFLRNSLEHGLDVEVPVTSLHSGKKALDKNLWQDLRSDAYPAIQFHLEKFAVNAKEAKNDTASVRVEGELKIAGRERPVTLLARAYRSEAGLWINGSQKVLMTDYGIKPRTMLLGTLKVRDEVVVHYQLLVK